MSQTTHIDVYTTEQCDVATAVEVVIRTFGDVIATIVSRTTEPDHEWELYQQTLRDPDADDEYTPIEIVGRMIPLRELAGLCEPDRRVIADLDAPDFATKVDTEIVAKMPPSVLGNCRISNPVVRIGWHDIFDTATVDEGTYIDRAFFAISLFGYGTPVGRDVYEETLRHISAFDVLRSRMRVVASEVKMCVYSYV